MSAFHAINPPTLGVCAVCGDTVELKVHDRTVGMSVGDCCFEALRMAHVTLDHVFLHHRGPRHPHPGEFASGDNH